MVSNIGAYDYSQENHYHVVIVGGGPAAVTAAIYCHRFDYKVIMIGENYGGAISRTFLVENYPGIIGSGYDLMEKFEEHYQKFDIPFEYERIVDIKRDESVGNGFISITTAGEKYYSDSVLVATGREHRKLNVPGEELLHGKGVSYCATCDGPFFRDEKIVVVGGSDTAACEALFLQQFAEKVYIVYRRDELRSEPIYTHRIEKSEKIEVIYNTNIVKINGKNNVESVVFDNGEEFECGAVFIEIGANPSTDLVKTLDVELNEKGEIIVDKYCQTNVYGLFAAGDVTDIREKQMITACGQAATAAYSIREYFDNLVCN